MVPREEPLDRFPSALNAIGCTPLIELQHISGDRGRIDLPEGPGLGADVDSEYLSGLERVEIS